MESPLAKLFSNPMTKTPASKKVYIPTAQRIIYILAIARMYKTWPLMSPRQRNQELNRIFPEVSGAKSRTNRITYWQALAETAKDLNARLDQYGLSIEVVE